jgi:hypothetical protein
MPLIVRRNIGVRAIHQAHVLSADVQGYAELVNEALGSWDWRGFIIRGVIR